MRSLMSLDNSSLKFERLFTKDLSGPYEGVHWEQRSSQIQYAGGKTSSQIGIRAPSGWSQIAVDIMAQKYACKAKVHEGLPERDIERIINRVVDCWAHWGEQMNYFETKEMKAIFSDELKYMMIHQMASPNSPQWFNTGLYHSYALRGDCQGHYYYDQESSQVVELEGAYERPQAHACFIQSVEDNLMGPQGITELWKSETRLFKFGSGTGTNFSKLRGKGEPLSGGGTSSGLMSWLEVSDRVAGAIKSGGTTRRAAKMVCLDLDHPEVESFIKWKVVEEEKVAAMIVGHREIKHDLESLKISSPEVYAKYKNQELMIDELDSAWEGEAYQTVSGQNSNNSIRIPDRFFECLDKNENWQLINRTDGEVYKTIAAAQLWQQITHCAWSCADPGLQFHTTINQWHTCPNDGEIEASNPCSEYMFLNDTACNLASLNLVKFLTDKNNGQIFDDIAFEHACRLWITVLDITVGMASYPSPLIAKRSFQYRTLGLGLANLGGVLMRLGIPYDSEEACALGGAISSLMGACSYHQSGILAAKLGTFPRFEANRDAMSKVISHHKRIAEGKSCPELSIQPPIQAKSKVCKPYLERSVKLWREVSLMVKNTGLRNAQVTAIAPTGTIGLIMDCDTTGIEPEYSWSKFKTLAGGGFFDIHNQSIEVALKKLGYTVEDRDKITRCFLEGSSMKNTTLKAEHYSVFQTASGGDLGVEFDFSIRPEGHLNMMAAVQPFVSGAISKTLNLKNETSVIEVARLYRLAHSLGLKSIAIYRDGAKLSQPLMSKESSKGSGPILFKWTCPHCGMHTMVPAGTCYQCENCGESTSC